MNWASVVKANGSQSKKSSESADQPPRTTSEVIVDTNALIRGFQLERFACRALTVQEVLDEVKDKKSRAWLDRMPFGIEVHEPDEEDVRAGSWLLQGKSRVQRFGGLGYEESALTK